MMRTLRPPAPILCFIVWILAMAGLNPQLLFAGGGPQNVLIVVNDQSADSLELGQYYRARRGIPEKNVCHVSLDPLAPSADWNTFRSAVIEPLERHLNAQHLQAQIDYLLLTLGLPSRIQDSESSTAVLFYGFKDATALRTPQVPCNMPENTRSSYYQAERAFRQADVYGDAHYYLAMMLTGHTLEEAEGVVDRGIAADGTAPPGTFYLLKPPGDPDRNVRFQLFDEFIAEARSMDGFPEFRIANENSLLNLTDIMGYLDGLPNHSDAFWTGNRYRPGAIADHFTSFGGYLPAPPLGQASLLEWIRAGATASYGTVSEPCAILQKFPDPLVFFWYARGFNLAESYWMSVANPYQGLFAGEPLAAPYAQPPAVSVTNLVPHQVVSGTVSLQFRADGRSPRRPVHALELFLDDVYLATPVSINPMPWNVLQTVIAGERYRYVVAPKDSLYDAVAGLARAVNQKSPYVKALCAGDRLMLVDSRIGPTNDISYEASTSAGLASQLTIHGQALFSSLRATPLSARKQLNLQGVANQKDTVRLVVTRNDEVAVTNRLVALGGESAFDLLKLLARDVNAAPLLSGVDGVQISDLRGGGSHAAAFLEARSAGTRGAFIRVDFTVAPAKPGQGLDPRVSFSTLLNENLKSMTSRGNILFWSGEDPLTGAYAWDTTACPNGPHTLRVVAKDGSAVETQGHFLLPVVVSNSALRCRLLVSAAGESVSRGETVSLEARPQPLDAQIRRVEFFVEGKSYAIREGAPFQADWNTHHYGAGPVSVQALMEDREGRQALSPLEWVKLVNPGAR